LVLTVPGNEGDGVSLIQQFHRRLNLLDWQAEAPRHVLEIDGKGFDHEWFAEVDGVALKRHLTSTYSTWTVARQGGCVKRLPPLSPEAAGQGSSWSL
jgi:hypothetical protein